MNVTVDDAYEEACRALGEAIVIQRLQAKELIRLLSAETSDVPTPDPTPFPDG